MRKLFLMFFIVILSGCASSNMISSSRQPNLQSEPNKSTLVIIRNYSVGFNVIFSHYIDGKFIGETKGKSYFVSQVPAGKHYLTIRANNTVSYQIDFLPGKTYYLGEGYAWPSNITGFAPVSQQEAKKAMAECTYLEISPESKVSDMDSEDYQKTVSDYQIAVKQYPEGFNDILIYRGE